MNTDGKIETPSEAQASLLSAFIRVHLWLLLKNDRPDDRAAQRRHGVGELLVLPAVAIEAADGAAGAGELGACSRRPGRLDHPQVLGRDGHERAAKVEVL